MIIPLSDGAVPFGILEVLSSEPRAFSSRDVETLQALARRIAATRREAEVAELDTSASVEEDPRRKPVVPKQTSSPVETIAPVEGVNEHLRVGPTNDVWTTVLAILVIATAIILGMLIGWRGAAKKRASEAPLPHKAQALETGDSQAASSTTTQTPLPQTATLPNTPLTRAAKAPQQPAGDLVVTQNGRVIYREASADQNPSALPSARLIRRVEPNYPADAKNRNIQGAVILDVQVLSDGTVGTVGIVSGDPLLAEAAVHAVRQWKYQPNLVNGRPVEGQTRITMNFSLPPTN